MTGFIDWISHLEFSEILLWVLIIMLLIWEFFIQKRLRKPLEYEIDRLKTEFKKLDFSTELSKKGIKQLYEKFTQAEKEIANIKKTKVEGLPIVSVQKAKDTRLAITDQHLFIMKLLSSSDGKRALANFVLAYYLNIFRDKDRTHYKAVLSELLDHELIDFLSIQEKTYMEVTAKGYDYVKAIEKMI